MKVLVTGANGFVGRHLCDSFARSSANVVAVVRNKNHRIENAQQVVKSINANTNWKDALIGVNAVIHLAARVHVIHEQSESPLQDFIASNVDSTINLAQQAASAGVSRFLFVSSVGVNGNQSNVPFNELDEPNPLDLYSESKINAELTLQNLIGNTTMQIVIIRPPLVYGTNAPGNWFRLVTLIKKKLPLPFGAIHNKRSLIHIKNLVDFLVLCTHHPKAANETFLISDDDDVSTTQLVTEIILANGRKPNLIPIPQKLLVFILIICGKKALATRLCGNLQVDITKAKTLLGWQPPYTFKQGVADSIQAEHQV
jgi:nucleoside-diphosphate-sugar epimerase